MPLKASNPQQVAGGDIAAVWAVPAALRQLVESGDAALVEELIDMFQSDTASRLNRVRQAIASADYATVAAEAHTIRGSALQVGANRLAGDCHHMEQAARKSPSVDLTPPLSRLVSSFDEVCRAIAARELLP